MRTVGPRLAAGLIAAGLVVAGCGVLALVLSTIGVYCMIADTRQIRMRSIWSSALVSVVRSGGTRPCRQSWQRWRGSLDLEGRR